MIPAPAVSQLPSDSTRSPRHHSRRILEADTMSQGGLLRIENEKTLPAVRCTAPSLHFVLSCNVFFAHSYDPKYRPYPIGVSNATLPKPLKIDLTPSFFEMSTNPCHSPLYLYPAEELPCIHKRTRTVSTGCVAKSEMSPDTPPARKSTVLSRAM